MNSSLIELRNRPNLNETKQLSDTLFIKGISRNVSENDLLILFSSIYQPEEYDFSLKTKGQIWIRYNNSNIAQKVLESLHQTIFHGTTLIIRFEFGKDENGKRRIDKNSHNTIIRSVQTRKGGGEGNKKSTANGVSYTYKSILCGNTEYPFPTGLYLTRIIQLTNIYSNNNPLLNILRDCQLFGTKYSKEISECMAMADCTQRVIKMIFGQCSSIFDDSYQFTLQNTQQRLDIYNSEDDFIKLSQLSISTENKSDIKNEYDNNNNNENNENNENNNNNNNQVFNNIPQNVNVYILGDGIKPFCASSICLHIPLKYNWKFISIDPLMDYDESLLGLYSNTIKVIKGFSQDYQIPDENNQENNISLIISCHSHAPLYEFWNRLNGKKIAIVMSCCADYSDMKENEPIFEFLDFEVYSPKRKIKIYSNYIPKNNIS